MAYTDHFDTVQKLYIAYYQRPADPAGLRYWAQIIDANGGNVKDAVDAFAFSDEAKDLYYANANGITDANVGDVVEAVYTSLFGAVDSTGKDYYVEKFKDGTFTAGTIVINILDGAVGADKVAINNKLDVAKKFTVVVDGRTLTDLDFGAGSDFNATYDKDDIEAAREMLADVTNSPLTVLTADQVSLFIKENIANEGDKIIVTDAGGVTYELTTGYDNFQGTSGNDNFVAVLGGNSGTIPTLNGTDALDGKGGRDTLKVDFGTNSPNNFSGASIKNIEVVELSASSASNIDFHALPNVSGVKDISINSTGGNAVTVRGSELEAVAVRNVTGANAINVSNSNASGSANTGETLKEVSIENLASTGTVSLNGNAISDITISSQGAGARTVAVANTKSDALTFNVNNVTGGGLTLGLTGSTAAKTVTLNAVGAESIITALNTHSTTKTLEIDGSAALKFAANALSSQIKHIDASTASGSLELTLTGNNTQVTLGSGNDILRGSVTSAVDVIIDGGAGIDAVDVGLVDNAVSPIQFKNFELLDASTGSHDLNVAGFTAINDLDSILLSGGSGTNILRGVIHGTSLQVTGNNTGSLNLKISEAATNPNNTFKIFFDEQNGATSSANNVQLSFIENVEVHSGGVSGVTNTLALGANATLTNVLITGDRDLSLAFGAGSGVGTVKSIDASALTGKLSVNLANLGVGGTLKVKGGTGNDTFTAAVRSDTLKGGAGADTFDLTAAQVTNTASAIITTIEDFSTGDEIKSGVNTVAIKAASAESIGAATKLSDAISNAFGDGLTANTLHWFYFGGDTYAIFNAGSVPTAIDTTDVLVKLNGIHDLSENHYALATGTLYF